MWRQCFGRPGPLWVGTMSELRTWYMPRYAHPAQTLSIFTLDKVPSLMDATLGGPIGGSQSALTGPVEAWELQRRYCTSLVRNPIGSYLDPSESLLSSAYQVNIANTIKSIGDSLRTKPDLASLQGTTPTSIRIRTQRTASGDLRIVANPPKIVPEITMFRPYVPDTTAVVYVVPLVLWSNAPEIATVPGDYGPVVNWLAPSKDVSPNDVFWLGVLNDLDADTLSRFRHAAEATARHIDVPRSISQVEPAARELGTPRHELVLCCDAANAPPCHTGGLSLVEDGGTLTQMVA
jgi:hypothetical protein